MNTIIDTDPGIDDAMAFYYAHASSRTNVIALTTIFGNVTIEDATKNSIWLAESVEQDLPVYQGASAPLKIKPNGPSDYVHGPHGFGDVATGSVKGKKQEISATQYLVAEASRRPGELTVCAIGPLTNIALALDEDENFISNLKQLVIMGGSLDAGGNVTSHAEANFWNDPHAANRVLTAPGEGSVVIVGLDVTTKTTFTPKDFDDLADTAPKAGGFLRDIGQFYMRFNQSATGKFEANLHDPAALIACESPDLFGMEEVRLCVITDGEKIGAMVRDASSPRTCKVCTTVESDKLVEQYKAFVCSLA